MYLETCTILLIFYLLRRSIQNLSPEYRFINILFVVQKKYLPIDIQNTALFHETTLYRNSFNPWIFFL